MSTNLGFWFARNCLSPAANSSGVYGSTLGDSTACTLASFLVATSAARAEALPPTTTASRVHPVAAAMAWLAVMVSQETRLSLPSRFSTTTRIESGILSLYCLSKRRTEETAHQQTTAIPEQPTRNAENHYYCEKTHQKGNQRRRNHSPKFGLKEEAGRDHTQSAHYEDRPDYECADAPRRIPRYPAFRTDATPGASALPKIRRRDIYLPHYSSFL